MNKKLGFIGCGNMAKAMIGGILSSRVIENTQIIASAKSDKTISQVSQQFGIEVIKINKEVAKASDIIILAVKPQYYDEVIQEISSEINENKIIVSIAPGKTLERLEYNFGKPIKIIRTMPNTPALVCEGITAVCKNELVTDDEINYICDLFKGFGKTEIIEERLMDAVVAVSGSSPAYIYIIIEAMADAAVLEGMPRAQAYKFAAQAVLGSAKMVLDTNKHPGELKDNVCSPGGTTIEAVRVLEEKGVRSAIIEAMKACAKKSRSM